MLAAVITLLAPPRSPTRSVKVFLVSVVFLVALAGLGAVFGKTLGDFLRGAN